MATVCQRCGQQNVDGAQFCANRDCGEYLSWDSPEQPQRRQPEPEAAQDLDVAPPARSQTVGGYLKFDPAALTAAPGESADSTVTVYNVGSQVEEFTVTATGPAAAWVTFRPAVLHVYPGDSATCAVSFEPPLAGPAQAGLTPLTVRATSTLHPDLLVSATGTAEVEVLHQLSATMTPLQTSGRGVTLHNVELTNAGNTAERVRIRATDPTARVRFGVPPDELDVPTGTHFVPISVWPPRQLFGRRRWYPFQLLIAPSSAAAQLRLDGSREMRPRFPRWLLALLAVLVVICSCWYTILNLQT